MTESEIRSTLKRNIRALIKARGVTQAKLGEIIDVSAKATISNYLNDASFSIPDSIHLYRIKEHFGIPLDVLYSPNFDPDKALSLDRTSQDEHDRFAGVYSLYYLTTDKISSLPNRYDPIRELSYGVLAIVKCAKNGVSADSYRAYACFSIKNETEAKKVQREALEAFNNGEGEYVGVRNVFSQRERYCEGSFSLLQKNRYYSLQLTGYSNQLRNGTPMRTLNDSILMMGFNPDSTDISKYIGGATFISSISRGRNKVPCAQILMSSRVFLEGESNEIIQLLPDDDLQNSVYSAYINSIIDRDKELRRLNYSDADRDILFRNHLQKCFYEFHTATSAQLFYLLEEKDQAFYRYLKNFQKTD